MSLTQGLLCIIFPPLAVWNKGCGAVIIVTLLSCAAWIPGVLAAIFIIYNDKK